LRCFANYGTIEIEDLESYFILDFVDKYGCTLSVNIIRYEILKTVKVQFHIDGLFLNRKTKIGGYAMSSRPKAGGK